MALDESDLEKAMDFYTTWLDDQLKNVDKTVVQNEKRVLWDPTERFSIKDLP